LTINFNNAQKGAGIYFENCPSIVFKKEKRSNIYSNRAEQIGSDLCVLSGPVTNVYLDTFTVAKPNEIHAYPLNNIKLNIKHAKIVQFSRDLYIDQSQGDDLNAGLSSSDPLRTLHMAFSKILADSISPHTIYLNNGEYSSAGIDLVQSLRTLKFVSISSYWQSELRIAGDKIVVFTPWWKSYAAFISYFCILTILLIGFWYYQRRRQSIKNQLLREHLEAEKLRELDHIKSRFFANISHEFRTPLTLILGPMQSVLAKIRDIGLKNELNLVLRNATRLERLVNQLLDLSRLEAGKMNLQVQQLDIIPLLRKIVLAFTSWAERKKISLKYKNTLDSLLAYIDQDKIEKIMNNLLSNAFKFTPEGGKIVVDVSILQPPLSPFTKGETNPSPLSRGDTGGCNKTNSEFPVPNSDFVEITVTNTGPAIPADKIDKIFDRFYQVDDSYTRDHEGTGIGLSLVKELVELHYGTIDVQCRRAGLQSRTTFTILLPLDREQFSDDEIIETPSSLEETTSETIPEEIPLRVESEDEPDEKQWRMSQQERPLILLIEDNPDMRVYIRENLQDCYRVIEAVNGRQGRDLAFNKIPDLVLSDIMMPEMDGFQVCEAIKSDMRTSHIPVILLTARAEIKDKLKGLERGADDYISKPFVIEEIKVRVKNLIEQRQKLRERFSREALFGIKDIALNQSDEEFLHHAMEMINEHIDDPQYTVQNLGDSIGMSRMTLHLKLKALTDQSPHNFIRLLRLKKAAVLLKQKTATVTEVAYEVGFKNLSHFAKAFQEQFGETPSHFSARH
jgi:signal transduction histidine kinase/DNA-binding response OmpR family regulator